VKGTLKKIMLFCKYFSHAFFEVYVEVARQNENPRWQTLILVYVKMSEMYETCGVSHKILH
jgi:hypothetical protein